MEKRKDVKNIFEGRNIYSLRKCKVGVASVIIGVGILLGGSTFLSDAVSAKAENAVDKTEIVDKEAIGDGIQDLRVADSSDLNKVQVLDAELIRETTTGLQGQTQVFIPKFGNKAVPGKDNPVKFLDSSGEPVNETEGSAVTEEYEHIGTFKLDPETGRIEFEPLKDFVGQPEPITIQVIGTNGKPVRVIYTPVVTPVTSNGNSQKTVVIPHVPGKVPVGPNNRPLVPVDPNDPTKGFTPAESKDPNKPGSKETPIVPEDKTIPETQVKYIDYGKFVPKDENGNPLKDPNGNPVPEVPYEHPEKPGEPSVVPYLPGKVPVTPNGNPLKPVDPEHPEKGYVAPPPANPFENTDIVYKNNDEDPTPVPTPTTGHYVPQDKDGNSLKDPSGKPVPVVPYENPEKPGELAVIPYVPGKAPVGPNNRPLVPVDPNDPTKGFTPVESKDPNKPGSKETPIVPEDETTPETPVKYIDYGKFVPKNENGNPVPEVPYEHPEKPGEPSVIPYVPGKVPVTPNGNPLKLVDPEHPEKGYVAPPPANPFENTDIVYKNNGEDPTTPSRETVTTFFDENGNEVGTPELGSQEPKKIPGYEFVKTVVDEFGNIVHTYEKVENGQTPVVPNTDQPNQAKTQQSEVPSNVDTQVTPSTSKEVLPNTGESNEITVFSAATMVILAGLGLTGIPEKKEDQE